MHCDQNYFVSHRSWLPGLKWKSLKPTTILGTLPNKTRTWLGKKEKITKVMSAHLSVTGHVSFRAPWRRWKVIKPFFQCCISSGNVASLGSKGEIQPAFSTIALIDETRPEEEDPWALPELQDTGVKWSGSHFSVKKVICICFFHCSLCLSYFPEVVFAGELNSRFEEFSDVGFTLWLTLPDNE